MKVKGRIMRVLPKQTGTRQDGTPWENTPVIFEFFWTPQEIYSQKVLLNIFDTEVQKNLAEGRELELDLCISVKQTATGGTYNSVFFRNGSIHFFPPVTPQNEGGGTILHQEARNACTEAKKEHTEENISPLPF